MNNLSEQKNDQKEILSKLTQSFLRKIREVEASPGKKDNLKKEITDLISKENF